MRAPGYVLLMALLAAPDAAQAQAQALTVDRLTAIPALHGDAAHAFSLTPDGASLVYVRRPAIAPDRSEVWIYHLQSQENRPLLTAADLPPPSAPTVEEIAQNERLRRGQGGFPDYQLSADGKSLLLPWGGDLYLFAPADGRITRLTETPAAELDASFSPDGKKIAYVRDGDFYVRDLTSARERRLTRRDHPLVRYGLADYIAAEEMNRFSGYFWSPRSDRLAVVRTDARPLTAMANLLDGDGVATATPYPRAGGPNVDARLYLMDTGGGRREVKLGLADGYLARLKWLPDGGGFLIVSQTRDQKTLRVTLFSARGERIGDVVTETSAKALALHDDIAVVPKQGALIWGSSRDGGQRLFLYNLDGRLLGALTPPALYVDGLVAVDEEAGKLYAEGWLDDPLSRQLFSVDLDPASDDAPQLLTPEPGIHQTRVFARHNLILDRQSAADAPPSVMVRDLSGAPHGFLVDNRVRDGHPYAPFAAAHVPPEFGTLKAADGQTLHHRLYRPASAVPAPVIVHMYGGPGGQLVNRGWVPLWYQAALAKGYAVFSLDNRGTARRGAAFAQALHGEFGRVDVADQRLGLAYLRRLPFIDGTRIALYGWSYGGYLAIKTAAAEGAAVRAVAAGAPVTDWRLYDTHYTERYLGMPQDNPAAYDRASVLTDLSGLRARLLLAHGLADDNVLFDHSIRLMTALQSQGVVFEFIAYPGAGHGVRGTATERHFYRSLFDFLDRTLMVSAP